MNRREKGLVLVALASGLMVAALLLMAGRPAARPAAVAPPFAAAPSATATPLRLCVFPAWDYGIGAWSCDEIPAKRYVNL